MFNFDVPRYEKVVGDAIALRPQIEKAVDEICKEGYSNISLLDVAELMHIHFQ